MTVEAGDCNGRSEGSKVELGLEVKGGGENLKDNGNASCDREGEEIGGSFVIVNGDSDDQQFDKDVDVGGGGGKSDPKVEENGGLALEKKDGEIGEERERSNGDLDPDLDVGDEGRIAGSESEVKVGGEVVEVGKLEDGADVEVKEGEIEVDAAAKVEEGEGLVVEGEREMGSGLNVVVESGEEVEETVEGKEFETSDAVEEKQDGEALVVEAEEKGEEEESIVEEREAGVTVSEDGREGELGSKVEEEDSKDTVVLESDGLGELEPAEQVNGEPEPVSNVVVTDEKRDVDLGEVVEESHQPEAVNEEIENVAEKELAVEVELKGKLQTVVKELEKVEPDEIQEPKAEVEETDNQEEFDSAERQTDNTIEADEEKVSEAVIDVTDNQEDVGSAVADTIEADEEKVADVVSDETDNQKEVGPAGNTIKAEERTEPEAEAATDENAEAKDVSDNMDSRVEITCDSSKEQLDGEANMTLESTETAQVYHVAVNDLVEGVDHSTDDKHVEVKISNREMIELEPKTDITVEDDEPRLKTEDCIEDVETNKEIIIEKMKLESDSGNESAVDSECVVSSIEGDQATSKDDDEEPTHEQAQAVEMIQTPPETHVVKRHQIFIIKVPRFVDDELRKKIEDARLVVDEKTKVRDSIGERAKKQAAIVNDHLSDYREALSKEKAARADLSAKRKEIEKEQVLIQSINNASSIADIDEKVRNMVHRQQHETISLKQEKQYIHEINQLKRLREQLTSKKAPQDQIDLALSQKDEIEARVKNLKKELDSCRAALSSAESSTKSALNKHMEEEKLLRKLREEHNAADSVRQEAYLHWVKLRNQSVEKAKHFKMYKADQSAATNYIFSGDNQGLRSHCSRQVEKIMDIWNSNKEFREQYVNSNTYSTVRRLGTLDGRSLGPDEEPPILHSFATRSSNITPTPSSNIETPVPVLVPETRKEIPAETSAKVERTNQSAKLKSSTKPAVSSSVESKEEERLNKLKKEEEELARKQEELAKKEEELRMAMLAKEEELRKEKAAAELRERLRLEQKAKAREAEERKRRKAEKAQAKAEYKAQKEAELKEKKKARKENKKSGVVDTTTNGGTEGGSTPEISPVETSQEPETSSAASSRKRSTKPVSLMKQYNKVQPPVPLPLRNKTKRKMTTWMWALLVTLLVVALFVAGNYISFSTSGMQDFGF